MGSIIRFIVDSQLSFRRLLWRIILKSWGGDLGAHVRIYEQVRLVGSRQNPIVIADGVALMKGAVLTAGRDGQIEVGRESYIGEYSVIMSQIGVRIGSNVMIAPHCVVVDFDHGTRDLDIPMRKQPVEIQAVEIGDNVWIGAGCKVLKGVKIGEGSVIGAGSVVTRDIPPYSIAVGTPAQAIRSRKESFENLFEK